MESIQNLLHQIQRMQWSDYLDIAVVAFLIYKILPLIKTPSTTRIAKAVVAVLIIAWLSDFLHLYTVGFIMNQFLAIGLLALEILFQPELRRMLEKLGSKNVREILSVKEEQRVIDRVIEQTVQACEIMAKERTGVLFVFERSFPLLNTRRAAPSWMPASPRSCCATCFSPRRRSMTARSSSAMTALRRRAASCRRR